MPPGEVRLHARIAPTRPLIAVRRLPEAAPLEPVAAPAVAGAARTTVQVPAALETGGSPAAAPVAQPVPVARPIAAPVRAAAHAVTGRWDVTSVLPQAAGQMTGDVPATPPTAHPAGVRHRIVLQETAPPELVAPQRVLVRRGPSTRGLEQVALTAPAPVVRGLTKPVPTIPAAAVSAPTARVRVPRGLVLPAATARVRVPRVRVPRGLVPRGLVLPAVTARVRVPRVQVIGRLMVVPTRIVRPEQERRGSRATASPHPGVAVRSVARRTTNQLVAPVRPAAPRSPFRPAPTPSCSTPRCAQSFDR